MTTRSTANLSNLRDAIQRFAFIPLFVEELGWDRLKMTPLVITVGREQFDLHPAAQKRGVVVLVCDPDAQGGIPDYATRKKIDAEVRKLHHEHLIIYLDRANSQQYWQWVRRKPGKPTAYPEEKYYKGQSGERLAQRLAQLYFDLFDEETLTVADASARLQQAFDVDKVTKRFYDRFKIEHEAFCRAISGIATDDDRDWYASLMLNRLMFSYFIQKKGFLDSDANYLRNKLKQVQTRFGTDQFHTFYREFLLHFFHRGLGTPEGSRSSEIRTLIGNIPYLNGGLFEVHSIESANPEIAIPDATFERIFTFFDAYSWHLDDRPMRADNEINPDVLGYIFEKYINQKQMGAYYTKEDITGYISRNTILPFLFEAARKDCAIAFEPGGEVWRLLRDDPDRYMYETVRKGIDLDLPADIAAGVQDVSQRGGWNRSADIDYALPTETWREHVARRTRFRSLRTKLANGEIHEINDLITYNLDIVQFAQDVIERCEGPELLRAFYKAVERVTVLDPTCGSGAFLFAALRLLEPLYEACLLRMESFVTEFDRDGPSTLGSDFRTVLGRMAEHPNRSYSIRKAIILNNLYGVDIMEEAVEIAKLRLFLTLVSQAETLTQIEPLPDIDFNIRAGNTLVGFATYTEAETAVSANMFWHQQMPGIKQDAEELARLFAHFREQQTTHGGRVTREDKQQLRARLAALGNTLDRFLAAEYGVDEIHYPASADYQAKLAAWRASHQSFHWFVEFYAIVQDYGGFDVIIGNPPYAEYSKQQKYYRLQNGTFVTEECGNLLAFVAERSLALLGGLGRTGLVLLVSTFTTERMRKLQELILRECHYSWISNFAWRPSKLFAGCNTINAIFLGAKGTPAIQSHTYSTKYLKWTGDERDYLFPLLAYGESTPFRVPGSFPKVASENDALILYKVDSQRSALAQLFSGSDENNSLFYFRGMLYWIKVLDHLPVHRENGEDRISSQCKQVLVDSQIPAHTLIAVLSSSLFFWFYQTFSDCQQINQREFLGFKFQPARDTVADLARLGNELMTDYKRHSKVIERHIHSRGASVQKEYFEIKHSKPIIDEIDRVLAHHYGFTDEELDFIVNYDIKYRMGADTGDDGDGEE